MTTIASQITSPTIVYSIVYSDADQRKHQSSTSLAFSVGNSPVIGEFPAQKASNTENASIWWRHHLYPKNCTYGSYLLFCCCSGGGSSVEREFTHTLQRYISGTETIILIITPVTEKQPWKNRSFNFMNSITDIINSAKCSKSKRVHISWDILYVTQFIKIILHQNIFSFAHILLYASQICICTLLVSRRSNFNHRTIEQERLCKLPIQPLLHFSPRSKYSLRVSNAANAAIVFMHFSKH